MYQKQLAHSSNNFDCLRIVAAASVVVSHQFALCGLPEPLVLHAQTLGGFAVLVFFSISGYLIAASWDREPHFGRFFLKRFLRVWPGLACTVLLCGLLLGPMVTTLSWSAYLRSHITWRFFQTLAFHVDPFLPGVFPHSPVAYVPNGTLWTIPIEFRCYLYLAALGIFGLLRKPLALLLLVLAVGLWYYGIHDAEAVFATRHSHIFEVEYAIFFFSGAVLYDFKALWSAGRRRILLAAVAGALGFAAHLLGHDMVCAAVMVPALTVLAGTSDTPVLRRFGRFGDLSYGVYIYGFPVQQTIVWLTPRWNYLPRLLVAAPIIILLAWLSWHLVERRALAYKNITFKKFMTRFARNEDAM